jgi:hypothetical protein
MSDHDYTKAGSTLPTFTVQIARTTTRMDVYTIDVSASNRVDAVQAARTIVHAEDLGPKMPETRWERDLNILDDAYQFTASEVIPGAGC